ncbi:MAG: leucyl aminopeptidase, partial [Actinomycetota bacterium]|nr:leucyl aminopeptidase [Actinomycetota bacterium]
MLTLSARSAKPSSVRTDAVVVGIVRTSKGMVAVDAAVDVAKAFGRGFVPTLSSLGFEAEPGQVAKLPSSGAVKPALVVAVGLGAADEVDREGLRRAAAAGVQAVANAVSVALALPVDGPDDVQAVGEGALLGLYSYDAYRSAEPDRRPTDVVVLCEKARRREVKRAVETAETVAGAVAMARDWVNAPPNDLNPVTFAEQISAHKSAGKVKVTVLDDKDLTKQGCGGILGVGQGSSNPPRLVQLTYAPRRPAARIALVGKGITFDSGGLSLKPGASMMTMKCDMGGAAAVVAATFAIAELGLPVAITTYAALAENMPSGTASRPGDVLTMRSGKTVEVLNTDAEGRLVL